MATRKPPKIKQVNDNLEAEVKGAIKKILSHRGAYWHMPLPPGNLNTVDFLCCIPTVVTEDMVGTRIGVFVAIEAKRVGVNEPTEKQAKTLEQIAKAGGASMLISTTDLLDIANIIDDEIGDAGCD